MKERSTDHDEADPIAHICRVGDGLNNGVAGLNEDTTANPEERFKAVDVIRGRIHIHTGCKNPS